MGLIRKLNITQKLSLLQVFVKHRILLSTANQTVHDLRKNRHGNPNLSYR